ncbi:hypothetical protein [Lamprocystis purpurea]|jgi:methylphosphotriester-DNA--protein-cysteine methyltransferase|uniref:hypothetical protein n=1 Tax=Lamprocystis purpurea TaxID=61598 RepID=UPI00038291EF|nr:hypothetical protein [Lamprocystis purpurea]
MGRRRVAGNRQPGRGLAQGQTQDQYQTQGKKCRALAAQPRMALEQFKKHVDFLFVGMAEAVRMDGSMDPHSCSMASGFDSALKNLGVLAPWRETFRI